jgi:hypothetical protein
MAEVEEVLFFSLEVVVHARALDTNSNSLLTDHQRESSCV